MSQTVRRCTLRPTLCPGAPYSHRAFLLKTLPLGSTGGPGRQNVQEDTHLGRGDRHKGLVEQTASVSPRATQQIQRTHLDHTNPKSQPVHPSLLSGTY